MKRALCIILVVVALTICFASTALANGEEPPWQHRQQEWCEAQNGDLEGQIETAINRMEW